MPFVTDFFPWVKTRAALAAILGGADRPAFYYGAAPQGAVKPYVVWTLTAQPGHPHMTGVSRIEDPSLVLDAFGDTGLAARALADALDAELNGYRGLMGSTQIRRIFRTSIVDLPRLRADAGQSIEFRTRCEYTVWYAT